MWALSCSISRVAKENTVLTSMSSINLLVTPINDLICSWKYLTFPPHCSGKYEAALVHSGFGFFVPNLVLLCNYFEKQYQFQTNYWGSLSHSILSENQFSVVFRLGKTTWYTLHQHINHNHIIMALLPYVIQCNLSTYKMKCLYIYIYI